MKKTTCFFLLVLIYSSINTQLFAKGIQMEDSSKKLLENEMATDSSDRVIRNNVIISDSLPAIQIKVSDEFLYVGRFDFEIIANSDEYDPTILGKVVAAGERVVFVDSYENGVVKRLFIVQFEGFLSQNEYQYNYSFDQAETIGNNKYRQNSWFYNSRQLAIENPQNEGAKTREYLKEKGYMLEDEFMMSRFVGLASEDRKHEIIIFYIEMVERATGYTLEELEKKFDEDELSKIHEELTDRSRKSFTIING